MPRYSAFKNNTIMGTFLSKHHFIRLLLSPILLFIAPPIFVLGKFFRAIGDFFSSDENNLSMVIIAIISLAVGFVFPFAWVGLLCGLWFAFYSVISLAASIFSGFFHGLQWVLIGEGDFDLNFTTSSINDIKRTITRR